MDGGEEGPLELPLCARALLYLNGKEPWFSCTKPRYRAQDGFCASYP